MRNAKWQGLLKRCSSLKMGPDGDTGHRHLYANEPTPRVPHAPVRSRRSSSTALPFSLSTNFSPSILIALRRFSQQQKKKEKFQLFGKLVLPQRSFSTGCSRPVQLHSTSLNQRFPLVATGQITLKINPK